MNQAITKLLSVAGESLGAPFDGAEALSKWGTLGKELAEVLGARNGFYAYESALLVRPFRSGRSPLGLLEWNASDLWKGEYLENLADAFFFAEDVFGGQFCIRDEKICTLNPETGHFAVMSDSFDAWAGDVTADYEFRTGYPLAHAWQLQFAPLVAGTRLLPKTPFVLGGKYEVENLYSLDDVKGMSFRASIANQIREIPDGGRIVLKTGSSTPPKFDFRGKR